MLTLFLQNTITQEMTFVRVLCLASILGRAMGFHPATRWQMRQSRQPMFSCSATAADRADEIVDEARAGLTTAFAEIDASTERQLKRVLDCFRRHGVGSHHFAGVDGYGHGDLGRETLDECYADLFGAEAALVRIQMLSGTHAIACALFGALRPGDELLGVSGAPYDTLEEVIGLRGATDDGMRGTLADFGVSYSQVELTADGLFDLPAIEASIGPKTRMIHVQRSCGYAWRPSIPIAEIGRLASWLKEHHGDVVLFVDVRSHTTMPSACSRWALTGHSRGPA
jgi:cystathionine beta-lyase family protein involved in aluminum resistance